MACATNRVSAAVVAGLLLAASATVEAKQRPKTLAREEIPQDFSIGSAEPVLGLKVSVVDGRVASAAPADAKDANVRATRSGGEGQTTLTVRTDLAVAVKFDLYVSGDGRRFEYASTCAVTPGVSSFEMWEKPVREFALGNPRVVAANAVTCD
ncbi:hypothetical protein [Luteimonas aquatica]|uniref:hypothetical protein n=1 Tax=Luteimonas aquatica TaxID=450364 RepID=UPI001F5AB755|nr:hypothetical protein [Luteimonas aquatica]